MSGKRLFDTLPVESGQVLDVLRKHWLGFHLGERIKESQNHTFRAMNAHQEKVIVRVTPDPSGEQLQRIQNEMHLILYLAAARLEHLCPPVAVTARADAASAAASLGEDFDAGAYVVHEAGLTLVVFQHAQGEPVNFGDWLWVKDQAFARAWGRWMALLHQQTTRYAEEHATRASQMRAWDELHDAVLAGATIDAADASSASNPAKFGVLHGDLNISNFFWQPPSDLNPHGVMSVFDWDQAQRGWFMWDLSAVVFFPYMLSRAGAWLDGSSPVDSAAYQQFTSWVAAGYESAGASLVDRAELDRMVLLRRTFYDRFCHRALRELDADAAYEARAGPMRGFMQWVAEWCDRENASDAAAAAASSQGQ